MLPLIAAAVPAVFQGISAISQKRKANRIKPNRPTYNIPGAVHESVDMARQSANALMPGMGTAQNNLQASTANAARAAQLAGSGNNALATIAAAQGNEQNAMNNLAMQNAEYNAGQRGNLQNQLGVLAGEQKNAWDWNHKQKFEDEVAAKAALTEAANQNFHGALSGLSSAAVMGLNGRASKAGESSSSGAGVQGFKLPKGSIPGFNPAGFYNGYQVG